MKKTIKQTIAIEGFDGTGKSTIAKWISENYDFDYHKSPSENFASVRSHFDNLQTPIHERLAFYTGDCIRISMMLNKDKDKKYVLDRYYYSTVAYHEAKYPGSTKEIQRICQLLQKPDVVFLIKADYQTLKNRIITRNENIENDELFLTEELVNRIYENYKKVINVPIIEIENNGDFENVINQLKKHL